MISLQGFFAVVVFEQFLLKLKESQNAHSRIQNSLTVHWYPDSMSVSCIRDIYVVLAIQDICVLEWVVIHEGEFYI